MGEELSEDKFYEIDQVVFNKTAETTSKEDDLFKRKVSASSFPGFTKSELKKMMTNKTGSSRSKQYEEDNPLSVYSVADCVEPVYNLDYLAKLYDINPHHAAAVDALVDNIVGLGYYLDFSRKAEKVRNKAANDPKKKARLEERFEDEKARISERIDGFNNIDTFEEIIEKVARDRFTMGNGFLEVGRTVDGDIGYIGHIPAHTMRIRRTRDGFVQYTGNKPVFFRNFGDRKTSNPFGNDTPNEVIHFKRYSPVDTFYGVPEIASAIDEVAGNKFANRYNVEYFENKAVPRYVIKLRGVTLGLEAKKDLLKLFETNVKGQSHRTVVIPLGSNKDNDVVFDAIETKVQEASFTNYTKANIQTILARHRVPMNRIGLSADTSNASSKDADKIFKESVCRPQQRIFEKRIGQIFSELSAAFVFKLNEYTLTDEDQQSIIDERDLKNGVLVPDERRTKLGLPPRPDGKGDQPIDVRALSEITTEQKASQSAAQVRAERKAEGNRERDSVRSAQRSQPSGAPASRNTAGEGRKRES